ncbi:MAG: methyl-accepting chemotaxis protein [Syntrophobacteraceae bacterium]
MAKVKLSVKLIGGFIVVAVIALVIGLIGFRAVTDLGGDLQSVAAVRLPSVQYLSDIDSNFESLRVLQRTLLNPNLKPEDRKRQYENLERVRKDYTESMDAFEALPKSAEEAELWPRFKEAVAVWRKENDVFFDSVKALEKGDILNPLAMKEKLEGFRGDHYRIMSQSMGVITDGAQFNGGDDPAQCAFGKWLASTKTNNPVVSKEIKDIETVHRELHESVKRIKELATKNDLASARTLYQLKMVPAAEETFDKLTVMRQETDKAVELYNRMNDQAMVTAYEKQKVARSILRELLTINEKTTRETAAQATASVSRAKTGTILGMGAGVLVALALGIILTLSITRPINRIIGSLRDGAEQVAAASGEVSGASQALAEGASQQAAALEETSSSLEEMASMTKQNSENAKQANTLMDDNGRVLEKANQSMVELIDSMTAISASSDDTAKIIKTIDEIAFQTNLLALNAAVEAARAGEAGAGFAVVADEVRNLAMRAADAARNTTGLIEGTIARIKSGSEIVNRTAEAFGQVSQGSTKVRELVAEITAASGEQAQGVDQISKAVSEMDKVVQQNAANAEETASASEELSAQSAQMNSMVGELVTVVGGSTNGQEASEQKSFSIAVLKRSKHSPPPPMLPRNNMMKRGELDSVHAGSPVRAARGKTPQAVIPFDEDMTDF